MNKAKELLERLEALSDCYVRQSGLSVLSELQQLIDLAPRALEEIYQAEIDLEEAREGQTA